MLHNDYVLHMRANQIGDSAREAFLKNGGRCIRAQDEIWDIYLPHGSELTLIDDNWHADSDVLYKIKLPDNTYWKYNIGTSTDPSRLVWFDYDVFIKADAK